MPRLVRRHLRRATAVGLSAAAFAGAAACSSSSSPKLNGEETKSVTQVTKDAAAALKAAKSVHATGSGKQNGTPISFDLTLTATDTSGSFTLDGNQAKIVKVGSTTYLNASKAFYEKNSSGSEGAAAAAVVGDRWVKLSAAENDSFSEFTLGSLADELAKDGSSGALTKTTVNGQQAVSFKAKDSTTGALDTTVYVANTGTPYPLKSVQTGTNGGTTTFADFDAPVTITAPTGALDLSTAE